MEELLLLGQRQRRPSVGEVSIHRATAENEGKLDLHARACMLRPPTDTEAIGGLSIAHPTTHSITVKLDHPQTSLDPPSPPQRTNIYCL